jgi:hypothetical protein
LTALAHLLAREYNIYLAKNKVVSSFKTEIEHAAETREEAATVNARPIAAPNARGGGG